MHPAICSERCGTTHLYARWADHPDESALVHLEYGIRFHNGRTHLGEERETIWARWRDHQDNRFYQDSSNECRRYLWALVTRAPAPPLIGISIGLLISFLLTALLKAQLLGVTSTDV